MSSISKDIIFVGWGRSFTLGGGVEIIQKKFFLKKYLKFALTTLKSPNDLPKKIATAPHNIKITLTP